jgi:multidrug efflux pump subunit AcrA (membrane-fusion protein)
VTTARVTRGTISTYVSFDGQVTPVFQTTLSTAEAGTVASVDVTEGDFVHKGQLLASLDTSQLQASLRANAATVRQDDAQLLHSRIAAPVNAQQYTSAVSAAQQNLAAANNAVRTARAVVTSNNLTQKADSALLAQGYVSRETYEQARSAYISALETLRSARQSVLAEQAALQTARTNTEQRGEDQATIAQNAAGTDVARANVELLQAQIAQSSIVAPFDGQVTQRLLDPGAYAGTSTGLFELAQVSRVYVVANVPDVDLSTVALGKAVTFASVSLPGRTFHGHVYDINTTPTSGTLSYRVRLLQPNADLALRAGMFITVTALRARAAGVLLVPSGAVIGADSAGASVFADETQSGAATLLIFAMALIVVYLVLAALYENLGDPLVILLSVPAALLGAAGLLLLRHITSDVYAQIGYVMLIGLAAKNAILIVEFAIQQRATGKSPAEAVVAAAQTRLRPILTTSLAFIAGLLPLVFASGAGAASRHSLGTAVVGGMLVSTVLDLIVVPAMYCIFDDLGASLGRVTRRLTGRSAQKPAAARSNP